MRRILVLAGVALVVAGALTAYTLTTGDDTSPGVVRTSGPLPPVVGTTIDGGRLSGVDSRGKALVVNFWNPYCAPCRKEATFLDVAQGRFTGRPVAIIGVLFSNSTFPHDVPAARRFARELGEQFPTIDDASHAVADRFDVRGIPPTVIADATGALRYVVLGELKPGQLERLVTRVLRG